ncbi:MAG: divergent PAP2 family protein [Clostridia bacterium]|nr:divergent PAP2 family protein [Anaerotignum sp.]NCC15400.1 divergent PAP2 family protein [Clostridia bacterium]
MGFEQITSNMPLWAAIISWAIAQSTKIILTLIIEKRFDATRIVGTGGMPSSHSALVVALAFSVGKYNGFGSSLFAVALILAFVVMYDAAGIRRAAGKQAEIINMLILKHEVPDMEQLKELLGHTPLEVFAGGILGIVVGLWI